MTANWLILDIDDTIVDTFTVGFAKCSGAARQMGLVPPGRDRFAALYGTVPFEECVRRLHPGVDVHAYAEAYDALSDSHPPRPIGDVRAAVTAASGAGFKLGVLTNGPGHKTVRKLAAAGLDDDEFAFVRHAGNCAVPKPAATAFANVAAEHGLDPDRCWYVSDRAADWRGAADAGFRVAGVVSGALPSRSGLLPHLLADGLGPIVACLAALRSAPPGPHPTRPVAAVSVDAGFTLIDHVRSPLTIVTDVLRRSDVRAPETDVSPPAPSIWVSDEAIAAGLLAHYRLYAAGADEATATALATETIAAYTAPGNWRARPGARSLLRRLRAAGLPVGVVSNWQSTLPAVLKAAGLHDELDAVVASAAHGVAKPGTGLFTVFAGSLGVPTDGVVHIGDSPTIDAVGALRAGCRAVISGAALDSPAVDEAVAALTAEGQETP